MPSISRGRSPALFLVGAAYLLLAGELPDGGVYAAACCGAVAVALCALAPLPGRDEPLGLAVLGVGAALLAVVLNGHGVGSEATPVEALFGATAGLLFGFGFAAPAAVVALPLLVAGIDAASLLGGADTLARPGTGPDVLTLDLPAWSGGEPVLSLSLLDATFLALFASWSLRFALRPRIAVPLMVCGLIGAVALSLALDRAVPTLPFLAAGFLLPALDRIGHLLRSEG
jgi:hypothetical protein